MSKAAAHYKPAGISLTLADRLFLKVWRSLVERAFYEEAIAIAERHVAQGNKHIACQRRIIAKFKERGIDLTLAESLLESFLAIQQTHEYDLRRLTNELNKLGDSESDQIDGK